MLALPHTLLSLLFLLSFFPPLLLASLHYYYTLSSTLPTLPPISLPLRLGDDTPLYPIQLSFLFPFYFAFTNVIFIDPNGAIHIQSSTPPCCQYSDPFTSTACTFETPPSLVGPPPLLNVTACTQNTSIAYTNIIMPNLMDLNPAGSGISYLDTGTQFILTFDDVPWWTYNSSTPQQNFSFSTILSIDGSIQFVFQSIVDPSTSLEFVGYSPSNSAIALPKIQRTWLVGLRGPIGFDTASEYMDEWSTSRPGVYPPRSWVKSGRMITFCPMESNFCIFPSKSSLGSQLITLTAPNMTCASTFNHSYIVQFTLLASNHSFNTSARYNTSSNSLHILTPSVSQADTAQLTLIDVTANMTVEFDTPLYYQFGNVTTSYSLPALCDVCGASNPFFCPVDCNGNYFGNATLDICGQCSGGQTGVMPNAAVNCAGTCGGGEMVNQSMAECLCQQLFYPPVVQNWIPGEAFGAYVGPINYYVQKGQFDVTICEVDESTMALSRTLDPLSSYQTFILTVTAIALVLGGMHLIGSTMRSPLFENVYEPSLYVAPPHAQEDGGEEMIPAVVVLEEEQAGREEKQREGREGPVDAQREEVKEMEEQVEVAARDGEVAESSLSRLPPPSPPPPPPPREEDAALPPVVPSASFRPPVRSPFA